MWILSATISMVLAGIVPILGKGAGKIYDKTITATVRAAIILIGASISLAVRGETIDTSLPSLLFFALSGICDAVGWLSFFHAVNLSDPNTAAAIEKLSVPLTTIISTFVFCEPLNFITFVGIISVICGVLIGIGRTVEFRSIKFALIAALGTSFQFVFSKIGLGFGTRSSLGFWFRSTFAFLVLACVSLRRIGIIRADSIKTAPLLSLVLTGVLGYFAWSLCYFALAVGPAKSVQSIMKLSFWITALIASATSHHKIEHRRMLGYTVSTVGILLICFT